MDGSQAPIPTAAPAVAVVPLEELTSTLRSLLTAVLSDIRPQPAPAAAPPAVSLTEPKDRSDDPEEGPAPKKIRRSSTPVMQDMSEGECEEEEDLDGSSGSGDSSDGDSHDISPSDRLFPQDYFKKLLEQVLSTLELKSSEGDPQPGPSASAKVATVLPERQECKAGFIMPPSFQNVIAREWASALRCKDPRPTLMKNYGVVGDQASWFSSPVVDAPVVALGGPPHTLSADSEALPKLPADKRVDTSARRAFDAAANALRATMAASLTNRAAVLWCEQLSQNEPLSPTVAAGLRRIARSLAFSADATEDAMQMAARSMVSSVAVRRGTWLRQWEAEHAAQLKLIGLPFKGGKLFGDGLEPFLRDAGAKAATLPSRPRFRGRTRSREGQAFRPFRSGQVSRGAPRSERPRPIWASRKQRDTPRHQSAKGFRAKRGGRN